MSEGKLTISRKLAIIIACLPEVKSVEILKLLSTAAVQKIAYELRQLGTIEASLQFEAFQELASKLGVGRESVAGGEEYTQSLLTEALGESKAATMLAKAKKAHSFAVIADVSGQDLATILSKEQPSTSALILGFLKPAKTAEVLYYLDTELREEVIVRLARRRKADHEIVERVEEIFVEKVASIIQTDSQEEQATLGGADYVAELFQNIDKETEEELMNAIAEDSEDLAEEVRDLMFTFDDIAKLDNMDLQKVLREVAMDKLVIALRGAKQEISDKFLDNLSKRAKDNLTEEMELMGKIKMSEVEAERRKIVGIIRALGDSGEISLGTGGEEDEYV